MRSLAMLSVQPPAVGHFPFFPDGNECLGAESCRHCQKIQGENDFFHGKFYKQEQVSVKQLFTKVLFFMGAEGKLWNLIYASLSGAVEKMRFKEASFSPKKSIFVFVIGL